MPTIVVETPLTDTTRERRFAKDVSMWLRHQGVDVNHVITRFIDVDAGRVFSGPFPLAGPRQERPFAFVRCTVGHERSADFRRGLAGQVVASLRPVIPPDLIFVQFLPTNAALHFIGSEIERHTHDER